jgi:hypothetical protein
MIIGDDGLDQGSAGRGGLGARGKVVDGRAQGGSNRDATQDRTGIFFIFSL